MKIGDRDLKPRIDNEVIFAIEEHFDKGDIITLMNNASSFTTKDLAHFIFFTVSDEFDSFNDFTSINSSKAIKPNQYIDAAREVSVLITKAFGLDKATKKK
jgi:hypothetical protein